MRKLRVIHYGIAHDHSVFAMQMLRRYPDVFEIVGVFEPDETARRVFGGKDEYAGLPWLSGARSGPGRSAQSPASMQRSASNIMKKKRTGCGSFRAECCSSSAVTVSI